VARLRSYSGSFLWPGIVLVLLPAVGAFVTSLQDRQFVPSFSSYWMLSVGLVLTLGGIIAKLLAVHAEATK
jgi:hypothetical protein